MKNVWMMMAVAALVVAGWGVAYADHHEGPSGEFRWRWWQTNNTTDADDKADDSLQVQTLRARIGHRFSGGEGLNGTVQGQFVRTLGTTGFAGAGTGTGVDGGDVLTLKQAWFAWNCTKNKSWTLYGGREVYAKGEGRIFGVGDWTTHGASLDGIRANKSGDNGSLDIFAYTVNEKGPSNTNTIGEHTLYGAYFDCAKTGADAYLVWNKNQNTTTISTDDDDYFTVGGRWDGSVGEYTVDAEVAFQTGDVGTKDHSASLIHAGVKAPAGPLTVGVDVDMISGQDSSKDSTGWRNINQDNHNLYGYQDLFGPSNLTHLGLSARWAKTEACALNVAFHSFTLAEKVAKEDDGGTEIDLWADKKINDNASLLIVYSIYNPGDATKKAGKDDAVTLLAIQLSISF